MLTVDPVGRINTLAKPSSPMAWAGEWWGVACPPRQTNQLPVGSAPSAAASLHSLARDETTTLNELYSAHTNCVYKKPAKVTVMVK